MYGAIRDVHVVVSNDDGATWSGAVDPSDTTQCTLTETTDFGVTPGSCAAADSSVATCAYAPGVFSASGRVDTVDTPDSCTSTVVPVVTLADTTHCTLSPTANFGVTPGTCSDSDGSVATCAYVAGAYSDADSDGTLDTIDTADSCTSTLVATVTPADTTHCTLAGTTDFGATPGSCTAPPDRVDTPANCTSTVLPVVTLADTTHCTLTPTAHFGVTPGSIRGHLGAVGISSVSLWAQIGVVEMFWISLGTV